MINYYATLLKRFYILEKHEKPVIYNNKYKKIKLVGSGTFGKVFLVENIINKKL